MSVAGVVGCLCAANLGRGRRLSGVDRRDAAALLLVLGLVVGVGAMAASGLDGYPPPGADWGRYLFHAELVADKGRLLVDDPVWMGGGQLQESDPGVSALLGSGLALDGVASTDLVWVIVLAIALLPLAVFAATGALWGRLHGVAAAVTVSVIPVSLTTLNSHYLGLDLALLLVPLVMLSLGRIADRSGGLASAALLGISAAGITALHRPSAAVVGLAVVLLGGSEIVTGSPAGVGQRFRRAWDSGVLRSLAIASGFAALLAAGPLVHYAVVTAELGRPPGSEYFGDTRVGITALRDTYGSLFALAAVACLTVLAFRPGDRRARALVALALASTVASQLWIADVGLEYSRALYYLLVPFSIAIGVVLVGARRVVSAMLVAIVVWSGFIVVSETLPSIEPVLTRAELATISDFDRRLAREEANGARTVLVGDQCMGFLSQYLLRRPVYPGWQPRFNGYGRDLIPSASARRVLEGGDAGEAAARDLGARYALFVDDCMEGLPGPTGSTVAASGGLRIVSLRWPDDPASG